MCSTLPASPITVSGHLGSIFGDMGDTVWGEALATCAPARAGPRALPFIMGSLDVPFVWGSVLGLLDPVLGSLDPGESAGVGERGALDGLGLRR